MTAGNRPTAPYVPAKTRPFRFGGTSPGVEVGDDGPLAIGALIDGRYEITGLVGEGGMGRVYAAEHRFLGRRVALKMLHEGAQTSAENVQRFRQEALLTTRIGHRGIVEVLDCATLPSGRVYMVMELLEGESMEDAMERPGPADLRLGWLAEVATALAAAHRVGVIHRDIKPANLFLATGADGRTIAKILDFGIAKATGEAGVQTKAGAILGTPYYLAPERALSRPLDGRADLYSLGVILYELLTGDVPFVGETMMEVVGQHIHSPPLDPRQAAPGRPIPAKLAELALSLLAKDPDLRPADGDLVAASIRAILGDERESLASLILGPPASPGPLAAESGAATVPPLSAADSSTQRLDLPVSATPGPAAKSPGRPPMTSFAAHPQATSSSTAAVLEATPDPPPDSDDRSSPPRPSRRRTGLALLILTAAGLVLLAVVSSWRAPPEVETETETAEAKSDPPARPGPELAVDLDPPPTLAADGSDTAAPGTADDPADDPAGKTPTAAEHPPDTAEGPEPKPEQAATQRPASEKPASKKPASKKPASKKPARQGPATQKPSDDGPTIKTDIYDE